MDSFLQIIKDKRITIPAIIIIILGVIFVVLATFFDNSNTAPKSGQTINILTNNTAPEFRTNDTANNVQVNNDLPRQEEISEGANPPLEVTKSDSDYLTVPSWVTNENDIYTLYYPSNWKVESNLFTQGQTTVVKPLTLPDQEYVPSLIINIKLTNPAASASAQQQVYRGLGYQTKSAMIDDKQWEVLAGVFPPLQNSPLPSGSYAYETQYYLDYKGISFQLIYKYPGTKENREYELLFQKLLTTFHIKA